MGYVHFGVNGVGVGVGAITAVEERKNKQRGGVVENAV